MLVVATAFPQRATREGTWLHPAGEIDCLLLTLMPIPRGQDAQAAKGCQPKSHPSVNARPGLSQTFAGPVDLCREFYDFPVPRCWKSQGQYASWVSCMCAEMHAFGRER